jgi:hypothetical protein
MTHPHPQVFLPKSVDLPERKGLEFSLSAKKCKRVWKSMKRQRLDIGSPVSGLRCSPPDSRNRSSRLEKKPGKNTPYTPRQFARISKERSCERGNL